MKKTVILSISLLLLVSALLCACGRKAETTPDTDAEITTFDAAQTEGRDDSQALDDKMNLYGAETYYTDALIPRRYLIVGEKSIVSVFFISGTESLTEIPRGSVARVDNQSAGEFNTLKITDVSGKELSFNARAEDIGAILEGINGN